MAGADLLAKNPSPSEEQVREALAGNLCRCTGYHNIVKAVLDAADGMRAPERERTTGGGDRLMGTPGVEADERTDLAATASSAAR